MGNFMFVLEIFCGQGSAIRISYFQKEIDSYHHQQWCAPLGDKKKKKNTCHGSKSKTTFRKRKESCLSSVTSLVYRRLTKGS